MPYRSFNRNNFIIVQVSAPHLPINKLYTFVGLSSTAIVGQVRNCLRTEVPFLRDWLNKQNLFLIANADIDDEFSPVFNDEFPLSYDSAVVLAVAFYVDRQGLLVEYFKDEYIVELDSAYENPRCSRYVTQAELFPKNL